MLTQKTKLYLILDWLFLRVFPSLLISFYRCAFKVRETKVLIVAYFHFYS